MARSAASSPKTCASRTSRSPPTTSSCAAIRPAALARSCQATWRGAGVFACRSRRAIRFHRLGRDREPGRAGRQGLRGSREARRVVSRLQFGLARRQAARGCADRRRRRTLCRGRGDDLDAALSHQGAAVARRRRRQPRSRRCWWSSASTPRSRATELGVASAVKMCRSVMIKGLEAMVIESFTTARAYGVEDAVLASLKETFPGIDWEKQGAYFFQRVIEHGRRRSEEVREVAETVREIGLDAVVGARHRRTPGLGRRSRRRGPVRRKRHEGICPQRRLAHRSRTASSGDIDSRRQASNEELNEPSSTRTTCSKKHPAGSTGMPARQSPASNCRTARWTRIAMCSAPATEFPFAAGAQIYALRRLEGSALCVARSSRFLAQCDRAGDLPWRRQFRRGRCAAMPRTAKRAASPP